MDLMDKKEYYRSIYSVECEVVAFAPGRIEVLGNHTDYNEGFVLSAAIDKGMMFLCGKRKDRLCHAAIIEKDATVNHMEFSLDDIKPYALKEWGSYIKGMVAGLSKYGGIDKGFNALLYSDLPVGAGLSSSAALEMSCGLGLSFLYDISMDLLSLAKVGQEAEHKFAGVKCGLLDQITSLYGKRDHLVLIDFRTFEISWITFPQNLAILVVDTGVKHNLGESDYNERRASCEKAVSLLRENLGERVKSLRDIDQNTLKNFEDLLDRKAYNRAKHVVGENSRVIEAKEYLEKGQIEKIGDLMLESHRSSQIYFENSCEELDIMVDLAIRIKGVYGARLSGGGFGGAVIVLVEKNNADRVRRLMLDGYKNITGKDASAWIVTPADGARIIFN